MMFVFSLCQGSGSCCEWTEWSDRLFLHTCEAEVAIGVEFEKKQVSPVKGGKKGRKKKSKQSNLSHA